MLDLHPIRTEADYETALAEIESLLEAQPGTVSANRLDVLSTLVEAYEREHFPIDLARFHSRDSVLFGQPR